jgi:phage shock protein E
MKVIELLKSGEAIVIDVRTPAEFMGGHVTGSINIPVNEIPGRIDEIKKLKNVVLCCASGGRSASAANFLKQNGIQCFDGGPWTNVNYYSNN